MFRNTFGLVMAGTLLAVASPAAAQQGTIQASTGGYQAGIGPNGELYDSTTDIGLRNPAGQDYILPGIPRDSWGITSSAGSAYADYQSSGTAGILRTVITFATNSATAVSQLTSGLILTQVYNFFAPNILSIQETVTNATIAQVDGIIFRRNVDFDIPPSTFDENVFGVLGSNASVVGNSYNGFESANPALAFTSPCGASCNRTGDLGAGIDFGVGSLGAGQSATFAFYYGINQPGQNLTQLFTQAEGLGLTYLIGAQSLENGTFPALGAGSAFLGVSSAGTIAGAVPEPSTWAMMLFGFGLIGYSLRRRKAVLPQPA
jgi:hypothetical protein